jgi:hypothetical protein
VAPEHQIAVLVVLADHGGHRLGREHLIGRLSRVGLSLLPKLVIVHAGQMHARRLTGFPAGRLVETAVLERGVGLPACPVDVEETADPGLVLSRLANEEIADRLEGSC